jgi:hypothetical protein
VPNQRVTYKETGNRHSQGCREGVKLGRGVWVVLQGLCVELCWEGYQCPKPCFCSYRFSVTILQISQCPHGQVSPVNLYLGILATSPWTSPCQSWASAFQAYKMGVRAAHNASLCVHHDTYSQTGVVSYGPHRSPSRWGSSANLFYRREN